MTSDVPFEVHPFSIDTLVEAFCSASGCLEERAKSKPHFSYFQGYFEESSAKTILVENEYIDRDFLEDTAGYYVLCFRDYPRKCRRMHFFSIPFEAADFHKILCGESPDLAHQLQRAYLGFIVTKPLPATFIGRTCLKTYDQTVEEGRRKYPVTHSYEVNLFGLKLTVESLAFQEQDQVASACATSALWSAFHGCGTIMPIPIPSPIVITKIATEHLPLETRTLPNSGLSPFHMAYAIRKLGLEPYSIPGTNEFIFKGTLYAYLMARIPVILVVDLYDGSAVDARFMGKHAIVAAGFSLGVQDPVAIPDGPFFMKAARIDKIYAHDDQIGPFARMAVFPLPDADPSCTCLTTEWKDQNGETGKVYAVPRVILIPLYHKIRITYGSLLDTVVAFNEVVENLKAHGFLYLPERIEWDIYLTTVNQIKTEVFASPDITGQYKSEVLLRNLPRFIWRASANCQGRIILDLLFDATDIEQAPFLVYAINRDPELFNLLMDASMNTEHLGISKTDLEWKVLSWFSDLP